MFSRLCHTLIHHQRYPLHRDRSVDYQTLLRRSQEEYLQTGCLYLPSFLTSETRRTILDEVQSILDRSSTRLFQSSIEHTDDLYASSSKKEMELSEKTIIAFDQIPSDSLLRQLYSWPSLMKFLGQIVPNCRQLYPSTDECGALYVNVYRPSNQLGWHTDHSQFFVNLLLQQAAHEDEGLFQYQRANEIISRKDFLAGGLVLFNGRAYRHRVTSIRHGDSTRINAILTYADRDDHRLSDYVREKFFGRRQAENEQVQH
jgi:alkylated DNA repair dioxygenase AlkB